MAFIAVAAVLLHTAGIGRRVIATGSNPVAAWHDAVWPELTDLLRRSGISDYSIFLREPSGTRSGARRRAPGHAMHGLPGQEIMRRWWRQIADIMQTGPDGARMSEPPALVFHMD